MADWNNDLGEALASGDPALMTAMLERVPKDVLEKALPYLDKLAKSSARDGRLEESLSYYDHLLHAVPEHAGWHAERARLLHKLERGAEALAACQQALRIEPGNEAVAQRMREVEAELRHTLDPGAAQETLHIELPPPPQVTFDPALLDDPSMPASSDAFRVDGLKQHLWRYSAQLSPRNAINRLDDHVWLAAWDQALSGTAGERVLFRGSELGVFALRALHHGAAHALCAEASPLDARIATGMVQKHFLGPWHARHAGAIAGWTEEERRISFDEFTSRIDIAAAGNAAAVAAQTDCFVFPSIDHSLLGTGIVKALRKHVADGRAAPARVLPARARVFAMAVQWNYAGTDHALEPMNQLRWSMYPQALDLTPECWTALTEPVLAGEIDFENFAEATWNLSPAATADGKIDAIIYWFELELGTARISNAPGSPLRCIKPAIQYTDPIAVQRGAALKVSAQVGETRLHFRTEPAALTQRTRALPGWYVPMLADRARNDAFQAALAKHSAKLVLDIGAGCGLLSMMAAKAGAAHVIGCEIDPAILAAGEEVVALNGLSGQIDLVGKDCRKLNVPDDLPQRADLAVFELFDCSLIGEGILHFLAYAREHLLTDDARFVPARARIRAMLIEHRIDRIWDIDANLLNPYQASPTFVNVDAAQLNYRALSEPFDVFAFDFASAGPEPQETALNLPAIAAGTAGAVLFWFDLGMGEGDWLSNDPRQAGQPHWKQGLQYLPEARIDAGQSLPLVARHNGSALSFQWQPDVLPRESFSNLPRCDPRGLAASAELEQQTGGLLQHCMQNPDEYAKVAEIAKRFAVDPAAYDLDPTIAQRFASMFLNG
ncbi:methyltransferase domain-containing protein [Massilia sp. CCM 9210]|uniref:50S ribosomal protein L11 methyltransferase n=1 Tax=Massilia scottii TaxID=3057166 RepID=UPI002796E10F|nr:methyltransferase domain-containing protein [Massilia sp. CCM 9210]MDQ1812396.1 methyltransferase domain-containing protein [Massilia sp. CCM 9210]